MEREIILSNSGGPKVIKKVQMTKNERKTEDATLLVLKAVSRH
jgi:hypothetical protein